VAEAISEKAETPLLVARVDTAPEDLPAWQRLIDLCYREATLQGAAVCWTGGERLLARSAVRAGLTHLNQARARDFMPKLEPHRRLARACPQTTLTRILYSHA